MQARYADAVATLYKGTLETFVAERKRLATELKIEDPTGAARLSRLARPTVSVWVTNQLWWQARELFEELFEAARHVHHGDLAATAAHREALAKLRTRAVEILSTAHHATPDALLRRVTTTLSALAATGGFEPDLPGALAADRDPPGFEVASQAAPEAKSAADPAERAQAERQIERERAKRDAERQRLEKAVLSARRELERELAEVERLKRDLAAAEQRVAEARRTAEDLEAKLDALKA